MFGRKNAVVRTKKYGKLLRFSIIFILVAAVAGAIAYGWQQYEETKYPEGTEKDYSLPDAFIEFAGLISDFMTQDEEDEEEPTEPAETKNKDEEDNVIIVGGDEEDPAVSEAEPEQEPEIRGGIVEKSDAQGFYDFRNSLFVGDYFISQAQSLGYFEHTKFAYATGLDMNTMLTKKVLKYEEEYLTLADYVGKFDGVEAVYIMISAESVSWMDVPTFVKKYTAFVDDIIAAQPDAHIYIQPILPINEEKAKKRSYSVTNEKINQINSYLFSMAEEKSIWILDMHDEFLGGGSELPAEYTTNGIRFEKDTYEIWKDYVITHKVH
ncbi:MAG: hypothetical protein IKJ82_05290 [Oscillospiraceae bacterium]|nr:hypothetical protein [Oscillospiraceae bacterium]